jgi:hypothetical protein
MISIFKRKNQEDMKPLTEADIQRKLYGNFQPTSSEGIKLKGKTSRQVTVARTAQPVLALEELPKVYEPEALAMEREAKDLFDTRGSEKPKIRQTRSHDVLTELNQTLQKKQSAKDALLKELDQNHERPSFSVNTTPLKQAIGSVLGVINRLIEKMSLKVIALIGLGFVSILILGMIIQGVASLRAQWSESKQMARIEAPKKSITSSAGSSASVGTEEVKAKLPYSIQVCIYDNAGQARELVKKFKSQGLDSFFDTSRTQKGKMIYRVHVGNYASIQEATTSLKQLQSSRALSSFPDSFVKKIAS